MGPPLSLEHVARTTGMSLLPILEWGLPLLGFCSPTAVKKQSKPSKGSGESPFGVHLKAGS